MDPINLGQRQSSSRNFKGSPELAPLASDISFPTVYLDDLPADLEVPKSGVVTFRYTLKTITEDVKDGEKNYNMELLQFVSVKGTPKADDANSGAAALDKYLANKEGDGDEPEGADREAYAVQETS